MSDTVDLSVYKETLLFLVTAGVVAPLFFRLRVSPVLGYLLAGVALGPYGLGSLGRTAPWLSAFAINVEAIDRIAAFGVVALLFAMGLELSFERLRRMRRLVFGLGLAQVVVTTLILSAIAWGLGLAPPSALTIGAALTMSSTAIVIPMLVESKRLHSAAGRASFSVLLFQDLAVAPLLVMTGAFSAGGEWGLGWRLLETLVPAALGLVALVVFGRLALRPFFHFVAETKSPEFFMAACLLVVLGDGLAAAASHLSMALGAFIAGLLLAETEYRREIEVTIEPFRGLLLGLYFVSVGAGINPAFIIERPALILGLVVGLVGLKGLILLALARGFRLPWRVAKEMALLLGPGGEFGFVMIGAALAGGLIDRTLATTLISAVALSMLLIPGLAKLGAGIGSAPRAAADASAAGDPAGKRGAPRHHRRLRPRRGADRRHAGSPQDSVHRLGLGRRAWRRVRRPTASRSITATPRDRNTCAIAASRRRAPSSSPWIRPPPTKRWSRRRADCGRTLRWSPARATPITLARSIELGATDAVPETIEASLQLSEAVLVDIGVPMGLVIASIHEKRDEYRKILAAAGAPERPRSTWGPRRG